LQVLATELKNNANKLAKWTAQALLAGAEQVFCFSISFFIVVFQDDKAFFLQALLIKGGACFL
jgi:hypothetical protein